MKNKINAILFWISFVPYVLLVAYSLKSMVCGTSFFSDTHYGMEAYSTTFIITFFRLWYVFTTCLIYQSIILLIEKFRNKTNIRPYLLVMLLIYLLGDIPVFVEGV